jgi:peroxiredoxin
MRRFAGRASSGGRQSAILIAVGCFILQLTVFTYSEERSALGRSIVSFSLPDFHGQPRALDDYAKSELLVVGFMGIECPLAKLYAPRLKQLSAEYADRGVAFVGIDSNEQDSLTEIADFAHNSQLEFALFKDRGQVVADQFGATRNPMAFVLDRERKIRYQGRIDDQYGLGASSGYARPEVKRRDLGIAIEELLAGQGVSQPTTPVTGCVIGRKPRVEPTGDVTYTKHIAPLLQNRCVA